MSTPKIRLYYVVSNEYSIEKKDIPLKHVDVHANVVDQIVEFELKQRYENNENKPLEIFYTFPTPAYASVYDAVFQIGDRTIRAVVKEKNAAKAEYNEAVAQGNGAYYMDRSDGDIFHVALGNVPPGAEISVNIKYGIYLRSETDATQLRLIYPLTMMPKYTPAYEDPQHANLVNPPKINDRPYTMNITGSIHMSTGLVSIDSLSSKIKLSKFSSESTEFSITDLDSLDKDIVISISRTKPISSGETNSRNNLI